MHVQPEVMFFISMLIISYSIDFIACGNKRIKIYVPEHIKHVHHHHVRKVPVYIVTKERPRVMHASHIEDDFEDGSSRKFPRAKTHPEYDDVLIQGIYNGDESHVHEDITDNAEYTTTPQMENTRQYKLPYILKSSNFKQHNNYLLPQTGMRYNRMQMYNDQVML